jgi:nitroimidazol reductase NimA-like FMN-containing flavoprotein (pyridoxamine 5'-phosphate oxidase superfamily)
VLKIATTAPDYTPHVVPLCFVYAGGAFYTHLKNRQDYKRIRNIEKTKKVAVLVDTYNPEWKLGMKRGGNVGVLVHGDPEIVEAGSENAEARSLLVKKYPQYEGSDLETGCPVLKVSVRRVVSWGFG